ncbi:WD40 repeat domain-containing protein [Streptomyces sp. HC44]|uniref:WD40 repeat domain-containing protein n=1 Tax=Streptomyces scabichelini TaxID=2711217 RepID=A0A6G4UZA3_9ACTN|nr:WD40 repeat domain-containing protein [Streptomyces scabichelini]NGO07079.1 WD40 repeat domain-containing protein [Streptomyces scabichelini]
MSDPRLDRLAAGIRDTSRMFGARRRHRAAEELAALGTADAVAVLADAFVHSSDPVVGEIARGALRNVKDQDAVDAAADAVVSTGDARIAEMLAETGRSPSDPGRHAVVLFLAGEFDRYADLDFDGSLLRGIHAGAGEALRRRLAEKARAGGRLEWVRVVADGATRQAGPVSEIEWDAAVQTLTAAQRWEELWRLALDAPVERAAPVIRTAGAALWQLAHSDREALAELVRLARDACAVELPASSPFGEQQAQVIQAAHDVQCLTMTRDGKLVLTGGSRGDTQLWRVPTGTPMGRLAGGDAKRVLTMATTPDGRLLVTGDQGGGIRLWNLTVSSRIGRTESLGEPAGEYSHTMARRNRVLGSNLLALALSPDANLLASGGYGPNVQLWRLNSDRLTPTTTLRADGLWVPCLAVTPDGTMLVSGGQKGNLRLWRLPDGAPIRTLEGHTDHVGSLAITPDGSLLASGGYDHTVRLWHLPSGEPAGVLTGHTDLIRALAMTPDGKLLASAGKDSVVRLWHLPSGDPAGELRGHRNIVECLAVSPDGTLLASGSSDGRMLWWTRKLSKLDTLVRTPLGELDPAGIRSFAQSSGKLSSAERAWFDLISALVRWRHRHDVELLDASYGDQAAAHDVELTDDETPQGHAPRRRPHRPKGKRKGRR